MINSPAFIEKAKYIKLIIFDVDGVFTDGKIYVDDRGLEIKAFHVLDGNGIKFLQEKNIDIAVISGRNVPGVDFRMQSLGIRHIFQGHTDKLPVYQNLLVQLNLQNKEAAYIGDDLQDLPLLKQVGLGITVPNAVKEVLDNTPFITKAYGGNGAIREVSEYILKAQGKWEEILNKYL